MLYIKEKSKVFTGGLSSKVIHLDNNGLTLAQQNYHSPTGNQPWAARTLFECVRLCEIRGKGKNVDFVSTFQWPLKNLLPGATFSSDVKICGMDSISVPLHVSKILL